MFFCFISLPIFIFSWMMCGNIAGTREVYPICHATFSPTPRPPRPDNEAPSNDGYDRHAQAIAIARCPGSAPAITIVGPWELRS